MTRTYVRLSTRGWGYLALAVLAFVAALYAFSGIAMAGSFAVANERDAAHWRMVARVYEIAFFLLLGGFLSAVVAFVRTWRRDRAR